MRADSSQGRVEDMHRRRNQSHAAGVCAAPLEARPQMKGAGGRTSPGRAKHPRAPKAAGRHGEAARPLPAGCGMPCPRCRRRPPDSPSHERPGTPARKRAAPALRLSAGNPGDRVQWRPEGRPVAAQGAKRCASPREVHGGRRTSVSTQWTPEKSRSTPKRAAPDTRAGTHHRRSGD